MTPLGFYMFALRAEPYFINRREQIVQLDEPHRWPYSPSIGWAYAVCPTPGSLYHNQL